MAGNVFELVWDGMRSYSSSIQMNPMGSSVIVTRQARMRGGSYRSILYGNNQENNMRSSSRGYGAMVGGNGTSEAGVRLVRTAN